MADPISLTGKLTVALTTLKNNVATGISGGLSLESKYSISQLEIESVTASFKILYLKESDHITDWKRWS